MTGKAETLDAVASPLNWVKWSFSLLLLLAVVLGNVYFAEQPLLYRALVILLVGGLALWLASLTLQGRAFVGLLKEARLETRKIVWPSRQETLQTTLVVVAVVFFMSLLLWGVDTFLGWTLSSLIG